MLLPLELVALLPLKLDALIRFELEHHHAALAQALYVLLLGLDTLVQLAIDILLLDALL